MTVIEPAFPSPRHLSTTVGKNLQRKKLLTAICQLVEVFNYYYFEELFFPGRNSQRGHTIFKKKKIVATNVGYKG